VENVHNESVEDKGGKRENCYTWL